MQPEVKRDFPLPLLQQCRSLARVARLRSGYGSSGGHVTTNVEMVADEVCCWLPNNGDWQWRPAATSFIAQHALFETSVSSRGACFAWKTNTQMRSRVTHPSRLAIRASQKQSQPLHDVGRQGDTNEGT